MECYYIHSSKVHDFLPYYCMSAYVHTLKLFTQHNYIVDASHYNMILVWSTCTVLYNMSEDISVHTKDQVIIGFQNWHHIGSS